MVNGYLREGRGAIPIVQGDKKLKHIRTFENEERQLEAKWSKERREFVEKYKTRRKQVDDEHFARAKDQVHPFKEPLAKKHKFEQ